MFDLFKKLIHSFIFIVLYQAHLNCYGENDYSKCLFGPPKFDFINESELCYENCLSDNYYNFRCDQSLESNTTPDSVDKKTYCCFHYIQHDCTSLCLSEALNKTYDQTDPQYGTGFNTLAEEINKILVTIQAVCSSYQLGDCESMSFKYLFLCFRFFN